MSYTGEESPITAAHRPPIRFLAGQFDRPVTASINEAAGVFGPSGVGGGKERHDVARVEDRYGHLFPEELEDLADRLDAARESTLADHTRTKRGPEVVELPHERPEKRALTRRFAWWALWYVFQTWLSLPLVRIRRILQGTEPSRFPWARWESNPRPSD